jgi:hypothetical protein
MLTGRRCADQQKDPVPVREYFTDENYISNFGLKIVAGGILLQSYTEVQA